MNDFYKLLTNVKLQVKGIADDSREVKEGYAFVAIKGLTSDGHKFIYQAKKNGAKIVIGERGDIDIKVPDSRKALSILASAFFDNPSNKLKIIGVTGTKGKTTTCHLIHHILVSNGKKAGLISTITTDGLHTTTPDILTLNRNLAEMVKDGLKYVVLEVSSHGIDQGRIAGINFDISVLTNIAPEHLDYHKTFREYKRVKMSFVNSTKIRIISPKTTNLNIVEGYFNNLNVETAIEVCNKLGISKKSSLEALKSFKLPEGRLEEIKTNKDFKVYIDFAHTPGSLKAVLTHLKIITKSRLIVVFGCAGDRDKNKRPKMGKIASELADVTILTAEDPRNEDVNEIIKQMLKDVSKNKENIYKIPDRQEAISKAINTIARRGDTVVICGKGHEKSMNFNGVEYPWQDKKAVATALDGEKVAVLGLGLEGKDLVNYFVKMGTEVTIYDEKPKDQLDLQGINTEKVSIICGPSVFSSNSLNNFKIIYRSPGIYRYKEEIKKIENTGVNISSAIKLFFDLCPATIIGITGTKGKGTTSTLIYKILKKLGKKVYLAGNIGKPYLELLSKLTKNDYIVLELSSFQLIDLEKSPHIAVVLNVTSDHMDWHKDRNEYISAKRSIVKFQTDKDYAVLNNDYLTPRSFGKNIKSEIYDFSRKKKVGKGCYVDKNGLIILNIQNREINVGNIKELLLRGEHNWENITAAVCAASLVGADLETIRKTIFSFKGLEHRLELVKKIKGVTFYNDSFATGPQPTLAALKSFTEPTTVILGGYDKGLDYDELAKYMSDSRNVQTVILIGDLIEKIEKSLKRNRYNGKVIKLGKQSMSKIVRTAFENTVSGGVIILSPAGASFDMYKDYKERGNHFKKVIYNLS